MALGLLRPTSVAPSIREIDPFALLERGIAGAIVDLDNTLLAFGQRAIEAADDAWVRRATAAGLRIVVVTNNAQVWARDLALGLGVPCIANARKPLPRAFRRALGVLELPAERAVVIGDQVFTDVLGAKLSGLEVILVPPLVRHDPWNTLPLRWIEKLVGGPPKRR